MSTHSQSFFFFFPCGQSLKRKGGGERTAGGRGETVAETQTDVATQKKTGSAALAIKASDFEMKQSWKVPASISSPDHHRPQSPNPQPFFFFPFFAVIREISVNGGGQLFLSCGPFAKPPPRRERHYDLAADRLQRKRSLPAKRQRPCCSTFSLSDFFPSPQPFCFSSPLPL